MTSTKNELTQATEMNPFRSIESMENSSLEITSLSSEVTLVC